MKRSDVVKIIEGWFQPETRSDIYNDQCDIIADQLLYVLENECGMLPPPVQLDIVYSDIKNQWEEENS